VDLRGIEPLTSSLRTKRATNCATGPKGCQIITVGGVGHSHYARGMDPLRIGILGASRITPEALIRPASHTGDRLVAIAARDTSRAEAFAAEHSIERVVSDYRAVIDDPEVEVVYNPLPNGLHGPWNTMAMNAGKHVLSEKPSASNAAEARHVLATQKATGVFFMEAFHYRYHPLFARMIQLATSGELGTLEHVSVVMGFPLLNPQDPRWNFDLAGGSLMDVGCYAVHGIRSLSLALGGEPTVESASAIPHEADDRVDADLSADFTMAGGVSAHFDSSFTVPEMTFTMKLQGSKGEAFAHNFCKAGLDDRITVTTNGETTVEHHGAHPSYTYQLMAFAEHVRSGGVNHSDAEDAVAQAELMDACYLAAGLPLRPTSTLG
jgi:predicted dehydrogenase